MTDQAVLEVKHLKKYFSVRGKVLHAVDDVTFDVMEGETFGIVGESGCGKTTCGKTCIGMLGRTDGEVLYKGKDVHKMSRQEHYEFTREVQMIFQNPYASLDPRMKVHDIIAEGIHYHKMAASKEEEQRMVKELLAAVGLNAEQGNRYAHEFSGGQRQRIGIARALAVNPNFLMCDEPISALDVSVQAQIVNLLKKIQKERNLTMIFIAHDLPMVRYVADRIAVMYLGEIVELAKAEELCENPLHPYTKVLLSAIPIPDPKEAREHEQTILEGEPPSPTEEYAGCAFCKRCNYAEEKCRNSRPGMKKIGEDHFAACHLMGKD